MILKLLFQDEHYVAVDKPNGLLVHRSAIAREDDVFALQLVREMIGSHVFPVHRLDRATSGVLLMAKSSEAASRLSALWSTPEVEKRYLAVVRGWTEDHDVIDYPLKPRPAFRSEKEKYAEKDAQDAVTRYRRLATAEMEAAVGRYASARYSLLALYPQSGRKHQIRRHMKHIFHPIVGDSTYGDGKHNRFLRERFDIQRLMLMLQELRFTQPYSEETVTVQAVPDLEFNILAQAFGWSRDSFTVPLARDESLR